MNIKDKIAHTSACALPSSAQTVCYFISPDPYLVLVVVKLKSLIFQAVLKGGTSPSAQRLMLLCACRYSVPPEHGKRLERLAKGTGSTPLAGSDLPVSCAHCSKVSTCCGPFSGPHVGSEPDCQIGDISEQLKSEPFPTLSWEGTY